MELTFDITKLNKKELAAYNEMNEKEKAQYEKLYLQKETLLIKIKQTEMAAKERKNRETKEIHEKSRKERSRRLIQRGAILESYIKDSQDFTNEEIEDILSKAFNDYIKNYIEQKHYRKIQKTFF